MIFAFESFRRVTVGLTTLWWLQSLQEGNLPKETLDPHCGGYSIDFVFGIYETDQLVYTNSVYPVVSFQKVFLLNEFCAESFPVIIHREREDRVRA